MLQKMLNMRKQAQRSKTQIKMKIKIFIIALVLGLIAYNANAQQTDCSIKLEEAESLYETGMLDSIPGMLRSCINGGFDNEELSRAYKLLILTYLFEDYQEMAELTMLKFLKKFPEYEIKATDPVEFTYLYKSYETVPIYSIGVIVGGNYSNVRIIQPFSKFDINNYNGDYSASGVSFAGGVQIKRYINENIEVNLDLIYSTKKFEMLQTEGDLSIMYEENQSMVSFPLSATYDLHYGNLSPFARLGVNVDYLMSATATLEKTSSENELGKVKPSDIDILNDRNSYNISALVGAGLKYHVKKGYVMFDVRYHLGLTNNVNVDSDRWNNEEKDPYDYIDDNFAVNNFFISLGYVFPFYKTKNNKR